MKMQKQVDPRQYEYQRTVNLCALSGVRVTGVLPIEQPL